MGQFSVEKPVAPGSVLSGNQQPDGLSTAMSGESQPKWFVVPRVDWVSGYKRKIGWIEPSYDRKAKTTSDF